MSLQYDSVKILIKSFVHIALNIPPLWSSKPNWTPSIVNLILPTLYNWEAFLTSSTCVARFLVLKVLKVLKKHWGLNSFWYNKIFQNHWATADQLNIYWCVLGCRLGIRWQRIGHRRTVSSRNASSRPRDLHPVLFWFFRQIHLWIYFLRWL